MPHFLPPIARPMPLPTARRAAQWVVLACALVAGMPALAAPPRSAHTQGTRASASLDFRIVIPESVRFVQGQEQRDRTRQYTSRTVESVDGRQTVTVARP